MRCFVFGWIAHCASFNNSGVKSVVHVCVMHIFTTCMRAVACNLQVCCPHLCNLHMIHVCVVHVRVVRTCIDICVVYVRVILHEEKLISDLWCLPLSVSLSLPVLSFYFFIFTKKNCRYFLYICTIFFCRGNSFIHIWKLFFSLLFLGASATFWSFRHFLELLPLLRASAGTYRQVAEAP